MSSNFSSGRVLPFWCISEISIGFGLKVVVDATVLGRSEIIRRDCDEYERDRHCADTFLIIVSFNLLLISGET